MTSLEISKTIVRLIHVLHTIMSIFHVLPFSLPSIISPISQVSSSLFSPAFFLDLSVLLTISHLITSIT